MGRVALILVALAVAALSATDYLGWRASQERLAAAAEESGVLHHLPEVRAELRRKRVPARAATYLAWSLLRLEIDRSWLGELEPAERDAERARGLERLRLAGRLAEESLARQPASWRAAASLGASRYLEAARARLVPPTPSAWRAPLEAAMRLAPSQPEPPILLAAAELSRWASLSSAERQATVPVLARALEQPGGPDLLLPPWVRLAPSLDRLLEPIPDRLAAWDRLAQELLRVDDVERYAVALERRSAALAALLAQRVDEARERLRGGDRRTAEGLLRSVLEAPPDLAVAESFSTALALLPRALETGRVADSLHRWLLWALDLCLVGRCPLSGETLATLAARIPEPDPADLGLVALAGDDPPGPRPEPPAAGGDDSRWNRYWIYRAERLLPGDPEGARRSLARASPAAPDELRYWHAAERLATIAGDEARLIRARAALTRLAGARSPERWTVPHGQLLRLELLVQEPVSGLWLTLDGIDPQGAAVELRWDGRGAGIAPVHSGEPHRWPLAAGPGLHLVEVESLSGRPPYPVALRLEPASSAG